jgi:hypothetical protein
MNIIKFGATNSKEYALIIMRDHNKNNTQNKAFILKEKIAITFQPKLVDGFVICTYTL